MDHGTRSNEQERQKDYQKILVLISRGVDRLGACAIGGL